jgi:hypothetical protein
VRVLALRHEEAELEVAYATGDRQVATQPLVWPAEVEAFLASSGLRLTRLLGSSEEDGLDASPTFYVLAARRDARERSATRKGRKGTAGTRKVTQENQGPEGHGGLPAVGYHRASKNRSQGRSRR